MSKEQNTPIVIIRRVKESCGSMLRLLAEENTCLEKKEMDRIEEMATRKDALGTEINALLTKIKQWATTANDADKQSVKQETQAINKLLAEMSRLAQKNFALLEARHTATRTFLGALHKAVSKPKVGTYGNKGQLDEKEETSNLMTKSV